MNENIDLTKILKNCPKGLKLYSSVYGDVEFDNLNIYYAYPIVIKINKAKKGVTSEGKILKDYDGECTLFPSKEQRDWSKFTAPWYKNERFDPKTLQQFDKVLVRDTHSKPWRCSLFSHIETDRHLFPYATSGGNYSFCIPFNDDTKHLVGTTEEAPEFYKYLED